MTRSDSPDGITVVWAGAATRLANSQGLGMAILEWRLMEIPMGYLLPLNVDAGSDPLVLRF